MAHVLISAAHKSSGKTTLSVGLCAALRRQGHVVQPFKKGPDYIDPLWLSHAAGRSCRNLDFYTMPRDEIRQMFVGAMAGADLGLIEGNKGLYDGLDLDGSNSNAALASLLHAPVVLVIDARGMTRGIAPLILGYQAFDPDIRIAGVILNKVGGSRHESKLRSVIEHYTDATVIGSVHYDDSLRIDERHLGLIPSNEEQEAQTKIQQLAAAVSEQVDLASLVAIANTAGRLEGVSLAQQPAPRTREPMVRIAYARDSVFGFYYPDDLEVMRQEGAELLPFDSLADPHLPEADGLFIGGGFPETAMEALEANTSLRADIHAFIEKGGPAYAECGGLMYLARRLTWKDKSCTMVGVIPGDIVMFPKPQGRGYVQLRETGKGPWPVAWGEARPDGTRLAAISAHEFHYSAIENLASGVEFAFEVVRGVGVDGQHDGIVYKNLLANYTHMRNVGGNEWARRFVAHVRASRVRAGGGGHSPGPSGGG